MRCPLLFVTTLLAVQSLSARAAAEHPSPVRARVAAAQKLILANPKAVGPYDELAHAYCRWGRDANDPALYDKAAAALQQALRLSSGDYEAQKLQVSVFLGKQQLANALALAKELNHKVPDDIAGWGLLVDVNVALGNYAEAERDAQWILDLRPGSSLGFEKAAILRDLFGDPEGAFEFFEESRRRTSPGDLDEVAWLLVQDARTQLELGDLAKAEKFNNQALQIWPDSQLALAVLAEIRNAQRHPEQAIALLEQRYRAVPSAENLYDWAEAINNLGDAARAKSLFAEFEKKALACPDPPLQLIHFYIDHTLNPPQALLLAEKRSKIRQDVATLDAHAWALYANSRYPEAQKQLDRALAVGIHNPSYFCHAAQISAKNNDEESLARMRRELQTFPSFSCAVQPAAMVSTR
ncbi:MAG: hypothetical protein JO091_09690 [Acidobacteriaceae bacterium]|nr:hypothetical protein [Acidobacteriaceae bacterium]